MFLAEPIAIAAGLALRLGRSEATLRASGALWVASARALVVADLHFEKGSAYAARGQMLPPYDTRETLDRLDEEVVALAPAVVVFLGDSLHDRGAEARLAADDAARLSRLAGASRLVWVTGNHDAEGPAFLPGESVETLELGGLRLTHEPHPGPSAGEVAGHLHPCAKVRSAGASVRRRCFVTDGERLVMPAFGALAGGLNVRDLAFRPLFRRRPMAAVLGRGRVHAVGWAALRPD
jgi:DNA ligase-associated metallophosphoesterase